MKISHERVLYVLKNGGQIRMSSAGGYRLIDKNEMVKIIQHRTIVSMKEAGLLNSDLEHNRAYSKPADKSILTDADRAAILRSADAIKLFNYTIKLEKYYDLEAELRRIAGEGEKKCG